MAVARVTTVVVLVVITVVVSSVVCRFVTALGKRAGRITGKIAGYNRIDTRYTLTVERRFTHDSCEFMRACALRATLRYSHIHIFVARQIRRNSEKSFTGSVNIVKNNIYLYNKYIR